jgi:thiosulfate dehydrogenase
MNRRVLKLAVAVAVAVLSACTQKPPAEQAKSVAAVATNGHAGPAHPSAAPAFMPPSASSIPAGPLGDVIRRGRDIFTDTPKYAQPYVGNGLSCSNYHLDAGRKAN